MVVGFNHNFRYRDRVFHIQTEDGGIRSPQITTLVYCGGTILASKKTSYADITKVSNLEQVVEDLMKEQHKQMLRCLRNGDFDDKIDAMIAGCRPKAAPRETAPAVKPPGPDISSRPKPATQPARGLTEKEYRSEPTAAPKPKAPVLKSEKPKASKEPEVPALDDIILSYLAGDDDT